MIFSARQTCAGEMQEGRDICLAFIDLTKAFDSVNREVLWACLARLGCQPNVRDGPKRGRTIDVYGFSSFIIVAGKTTL